MATIAGATVGVSLRLGLAMLALQFAIGAANDLADVSADRLAKPHKPIPAGLIPQQAAVGVCASAAVVGLGLAATVGAGVLVIAILGLLDGLLYDLRLKSTPLAWLPFAVGVGLLPMYAWWGARGSMPVAFVGVMALAVVAGAALALANAYSDIDDDAASGVKSVAVLLGRRTTLIADGVLVAVVQVVALATTVATVGPTALMALEVVGCGLSWFGLGLATASRDRLGRDRLRRHTWEVQAVGIVVTGMGWLAALRSAGLLGN